MKDKIHKNAARYYKWGANVTAIKRGAKRPVHKWKAYHTRRQTKEEARALPWHKAGGVGIISGVGNWRCIDIDDSEAFTVVQKILGALGIPHSYKWVVKSGSGRGWHIWIWCAGELPSGLLTAKSGEPGVLTGLPRNGFAFDHLELRWERCQTVMPPSEHVSGGCYQFYNGAPEEPPLEVSAERVASALRAVCRAPEPDAEPEVKARRNGRAAGGRADANGRDEPLEGLAFQIVGKAIDRARQTHERNKTGLWLACQLRDNRFSKADALRYGRQYAGAVTGDKAEPYAFGEYESSVEQAYSRAAREPWSASEAGGSGHSHRGVNDYLKKGQHDAQGPFTPSHLLRNRDGVNDGAGDPQATPLFGFEKPAPLRWKVAGLIPEGHVSMLAADGGTGKSFLSLYLALRICIGKAFFGLDTQRGRVLYVDYELDATEQQRRVWRVCEGMGMAVDDDRLKERFFYFRPSAPLGTPEAHKQVIALIEHHAIDMVVLDSLTVGSAGSDVTASEDVVPVMQRLREWGTVFAIDHISGNAARGNQSRATPFGSVFKRNMARSTFTLAKADGGGYLLTPDKSNFTARHDLVCYAVEFEGSDGPVRFEKVDTTDGRMAGSLRDMSSYEVTLTAINRLSDDDRPVTPEQIVTWRDQHDVDPIKAGTVRNHFTVLKERGKIEVKDGGALPAVHVFKGGSHGGSDHSHRGVNGHAENAPQTPQTHSHLHSSLGGVNGQNKSGDSSAVRLTPRPDEDISEDEWET